MSVKFECCKLWLGVYLTQRGVHHELVQLCEEKLVVKEGFCSPLFFMRVNFQAQHFSRIYLQKLGITALGLCEELLSLHKDLTLAFNGQYEASPDAGTTAAVRAALQIVLPTFVNVGTHNTQKKSWLNMFLTENNAPDHLIYHCEEVLVQKEGFGSPLTLARTSHHFFNRAYLNTQGITMLGVREALLALHSDLQKEFTNHSPFHYHTINEAEIAARTAVMAVLPVYFENNDKSCAKQTEEQDMKDTSSDANNDPVYVPFEQDWTTLD